MTCNQLHMTGSWFDPTGFPGGVLEAIKKHALQEYPRESCGAILEGGYYPCTNIAQRPKGDFEISSKEWAFVMGLTPKAFVHSHPVDKGIRWEPGVGYDCPSEVDMMGQLNSGLPWGIVLTDGSKVAPAFWWGNFSLNVPLVGRPFRHGAMDCYSLIRSWYWQNKKVFLPEFPRGDMWWDKTPEKNMYNSGFPEAGFVSYETDNPSVGDVFIMQVKSDVDNHGGVYTGSGVVLHHLPRQLSRHVPASWRVNQWLKFKGEVSVAA